MKSRFTNLLETAKMGEFYYNEEIDEEGYFYEIQAEYKKEPVDIIILETGVSIDYINKGYHVHTNIIPNNLFGELLKLEPKHLEEILRIIAITGGEGKSYDTQKMFKEWQELGEP